MVALAACSTSTGGAPTAPATTSNTVPSAAPSSAAPGTLSTTPPPSASAPASSAPASASAAPASASPASTPARTGSFTSVPPTTVSAECMAPSVKTLTTGTLTIGTDNPAFPPWFGGTPPAGSTWQVSDPTSQQGLESATAYAIAQQLGFSPDKVTWVVVPFDNAIQPGPKKFDILLNQVSYSADRAQAVDLSDGYFDDSQAIVTDGANPIGNVKSIADLKKFQLGVQVGTTSLAYITDNIKPDKQARVYNTNDAAVAALKAKQVDGIVVDLGTAFYMVSAQLDNGKIVGSLPSIQAPEHFSVLLQKGSALTSCVTQALAVLKANGTLDTIRMIWIEAQGNAPAITP
jgi:polar amino acid transport system substrate-binding protein